MMATAAAVPVHLLGLELSGFLAGGHRGMRIRIVFWITLRHAGITERLRRQRRGLRGGGERGGSRRDTECEFQKISAFHHVFLIGQALDDAEEVSGSRDELRLNRAFRFAAR